MFIAASASQLWARTDDSAGCYILMLHLYRNQLLYNLVMQA